MVTDNCYFSLQHVVWQELLLAAIGEQLSECMAEEDEICGISVKIRGYGSVTIQIWNVDSDKHLDARVSELTKGMNPPEWAVSDFTVDGCAMKTMNGRSFSCCMDAVSGYFHRSLKWSLKIIIVYSTYD